ncbi:acyltransferase family protein [Aquihabitans sp. McL0605]|uniref:acyltransferase family protein n=1 Tax=Aquihabitans sp. McL0605 TaxID=3415671 RepID=UPI003CF09BE5
MEVVEEPVTPLDADAAERAVGWTHRPGLDGVRGLAVVAVVAYHLGYLSGGFLGVDVFLVLSGYLITGLALGEIGTTGRLGLLAFWGRRVRRLVPALLVVVGAVTVVAVLVGWPRNQWHALGWDGVATLTWWANWRQVQGPSYWASGQNLFRHAWSLSIEEQFYLVWPLALVASAAVTRRTGRSLAAVVGTVAVVGAVASTAWQLLLSHHLAPERLSRVYVGTDTRAVAPLLGCALACVLAGGRSRAVAGRAGRAVGAVGAVVLVGLVATADVASPALYRNGILVVASLASAAVVARASTVHRGDRSVLAWTTTAPIARYLGSRSYAIYLWSWPIQVLVAFRWPSLARPWLALVTVTGALALAEASFRLVEDPIRRRTGWARRGAVRRTAWTVGIVGAAGVLVTALVLAVPPPAYQRVDTAEASSSALRAGLTSPTVTAAPGQPPLLKVMLSGDSVAWTMGFYGPVGADLPPGIGSIDTRAILGCGLLAADGYDYPLDRDDAPFVATNRDCAKQPQAEAVGLEADPDVVVLLPGAWEWSRVRAPDGTVLPARSPQVRTLLRDRMLARIDAANAAGARFAMVEFSCPGSKAVAARRDPDYIRWINRLIHEVADDATRHGRQVDVIAPTGAVCVGGDPAGRPTAAKDQAMGKEVHVVSPEGGRWAWDTWIGPALTGQ